jgi:UPF0716 protein FxsA
VIPRLGCLFIVVPLIELALLIQVGQWVGVWPTVALVALTGVAGIALVRHEGIRTLANVQLELAGGRLPGRALLDGACLLVAGALLTTPGVITDVLAFALLASPTRRLAQGWLMNRMKRAVEQGTLHVQMGGFPGMGGPWDGGGRGPGRRDRDEDDEDEGDPGRGPRPGEIVQD